MVKTSLAAGNAPDIIDIYEAAVSTMDLAAAGQIFDLKTYLDSDPEWKNALIPSALKADSWDEGQHFFTMPISVNNVQVCYNKDLFDKAGVRGAEDAGRAEASGQDTAGHRRSAVGFRRERSVAGRRHVLDPCGVR